jgi:hypothetical protein
MQQKQTINKPIDSSEVHIQAINKLTQSGEAPHPADKGSPQ